MPGSSKFWFCTKTGFGVRGSDTAPEARGGHNERLPLQGARAPVRQMCTGKRWQGNPAQSAARHLYHHWGRICPFAAGVASLPCDVRLISPDWMR